MSRSKYKAPKRIAGVKLSKPVRKSATKVLNGLDTPQGRGLVVAGIGAFAAALMSPRFRGWLGEFANGAMAEAGKLRDSVKASPARVAKA